MNIINRSSKLLSSKLSSFLLVIVVLHMVAQAISPKYSTLAMLLITAEMLGWVSIFLMGVTWLVKRGLPKAWRALWTLASTPIRTYCSFVPTSRTAKPGASCAVVQTTCAWMAFRQS